ncbi:uncharacterized protein VTP21DRAFT_7675 [Calcarisporiella thermophila]|uniref:uncharacterized protein n=1 Tax=Calcarisporiella thermophila TaxID=911321 RepID=UPI0037427715
MRARFQHRSYGEDRRNSGRQERGRRRAQAAAAGCGRNKAREKTERASEESNGNAARNSGNINKKFLLQ